MSEQVMTAERIMELRSELEKLCAGLRERLADGRIDAGWLDVLTLASGSLTALAAKDAEITRLSFDNARLSGVIGEEDSFARAALAEAQREIERLKGDAEFHEGYRKELLETTVQANRERGLAEAALAAQRQQVRALRERVQRRLDKVLYSLNEHHNDVDDATARALDSVLSWVDALGLAADAPATEQP